LQSQCLAEQALGATIPGEKHDPLLIYYLVFGISFVRTARLHLLDVQLFGTRHNPGGDAAAGGEISFK
jgi:hypothetical protein